MLIGITLGIMMVLTLFSIIAGNSFIGIITEGLVDNSALINGTTTTFEIPVDDFVFGLDPIWGGLALITALATIGAIITIQIVGSGLSANGTRIIMVSIFYIGIWTILSFLAEPLISSISVFGSLMYLTLTLLYAIGVVSKYFGGGGGTE